MSKRQIFSKLIISLVIGIPAGFILAVLLTPLLWRLEEIIPLELAGHGGPADWILLTIAILVSIVIFIVIIKLTKNKKEKKDIFSSN